MKLCHLRTGVPLLDASALPVLISTINHAPLQQNRKSYITTSGVRMSLVTESNTSFAYIKIFISFNHLIPGKSNQASSLSTSFWQWQRLSLEYCACQANALSVNYSLSPPFPSEAIENHSLNHPRATDYHTGPSCLIVNVFNPPQPLGFVALGISE